MQTCWLKKNNRDSCILFFTGWGMDPEPFRRIPVMNHDLLVVYDYRVLEESADVEFALEHYKQVHLIAWSMGVWTSALSFAGRSELLTTATAVNGTLFPVDDQLGIERKAYSEMIDHFSPSTLNEFYRNMFSTPGESKLFTQNGPIRPLNNILDELIKLMQYYTAEGPADDIFNDHIVGSRDRIFPARHQIRCWGRENCTVIKASHFPFYAWSSWDRVIHQKSDKA